MVNRFENEGRLPDDDFGLVAKGDFFRDGS